MRQDGFRIILFVVGLSLLGCGQHSKPNFTFMPDMAYSPAIKAQSEGSMRLPPPGTQAQGFKPYAFSKNPDEAGRSNKNPLPKSKAVLLRGQTVFNTYCMVCHGPGGEGDGTIVPKFPRPPSLLSDRVKGYPDGRIFHIITEGQNLMPSYASQVRENDRWAVTHFIRALNRAKNPTSEDIKAFEAFNNQ